MNTNIINPTATVVPGTSAETAAALSATSVTTPTPAAKNGHHGKGDDARPAITEILPDSTDTLFPPTPMNFKKLDGEYLATVTRVQLVEEPSPEATTSRKAGRKTKAVRKAKGGKRKPAAKTKSKPKLLRLTFTLDHQRADGAAYTVTKDLRSKRSQESTFGEFLKQLLPDPASFSGFFADFRPARLHGCRCTLKIKESRRLDQSSFNIVSAAPAPTPAPAPELAYVGRMGSTVTGQIREAGVELTTAA